MKPLIITTHESAGLLNGSITQLRRDVKPSRKQRRFLSVDLLMKSGLDYVTRDGAQFIHPLGGPLTFIKCSFHPNDKLYCRETWAELQSPPNLQDNTTDTGLYIYKSDEPSNPLCYGSWFRRYSWHSPATMPRDAARIFLEVVNVRVERTGEKWQWVYDVKLIKQP